MRLPLLFLRKFTWVCFAALLDSARSGRSIQQFHTLVVLYVRDILFNREIGCNTLVSVGMTRGPGRTTTGV